jgi:CRP-like cAMP-binding protein
MGDPIMFDEPTPQDARTSPVEQFTTLWQSGENPPDVRMFVERQDRLSSDELVQILLVDQAYRWRTKRPCLVEEYLESWPQLAAEQTLRLELTCGEMRAILNRGDTPNLESFAQRFPDLREALAQWMETGSGWETTCAGQDSSATTDLDSLPAEVKRAILQRAIDRRFRPGENLISQGSSPSCLVVIVDGTVEIGVTEGEGNVRVLARKSKGTVLGEMALLMGVCRTAHARALTDVRAKILSSSDYYRLARDFPVLEATFGRLIATRLGTTEKDVLCGKRIRGYLLERCLGRGARGVVYQAHDSEHQRRVAVKMLNYSYVFDPLAVRRFVEREMEVSRELRHENIAISYDCFAENRTHFIVMEYCEGPDLATICAQREPLAEGQVRGVVGQLAGALAYAHEHGVVHRDLKPSNVVLTTTGHVKLLDFGLARYTRNSPAMAWTGALMTEERVVVGTPLYMAPEQHRTSDVDERADLYALGCIAYELLTGMPPFSRSAATLDQLYREKLEFQLRRDQLPQQACKELVHFLEVALEPDADDRDIRVLNRMASTLADEDVQALRSLAARYLHADPGGQSSTVFMPPTN